MTDKGFGISILILIIFLPAFISFFVARNFQRGWIYAPILMLVIFLALSPFMIMLFLIVFYVWSPYFLGTWTGTALGTIARQYAQGPGFFGTATNPLWHGPIVGLVGCLPISLTFSHFIVPKLAGAHAVSITFQNFYWQIIMSSLWGTLALLLFGRLRGATRVIAFTGGMAILTYIYGEAKVFLSPELRGVWRFGQSFFLAREALHLFTETLMGSTNLILLFYLRRLDRANDPV